MDDSESERKRIPKKLMIFLVVWMTFALCPLVFPELIGTATGRLIFGIEFVLLILFIHLYLRKERDTRAKRYLWYATLIVLIYLAGFWFYDILSDYYLIGNF
jgi:hypothetical protein